MLAAATRCRGQPRRYRRRQSMVATAPSSTETAQSDDVHLKSMPKEKRLSLLEQRGREAVPLACTCVVLSYLDISGILSLGAASVRSRHVARSDAVCDPNNLDSDSLRCTHRCGPVDFWSLLIGRFPNWMNACGRRAPRPQRCVSSFRPLMKR